MNQVILLGRITKDPELKQTQSGVPVCSFTVACDRRYQKEGEDRQADFINCVAWRQTAEFINRFFVKGMRIALVGSIQTRSWDDEKGNKRYATEVIVEHAEFASDKRNNAPEASQPISSPAVPSGDIDGFMPIDYDEDLPF